MRFLDSSGPTFPFEKSHSCLKHTNLLCLDVLVHALPLQPAGAGALACPWALHRRLEGADDEVVELRENGCW